MPRKFVKPSDRTKPVLEMLSARTHSFDSIAQQLGVSLNVVLGINSHFRRGRYVGYTASTSVVVADRRVDRPRVRTDRGWTYLLVSRCGATYVGATTDLRHRFRSHNSPDNPGLSRGRQWMILGVRRFGSRREAFDHEAELKRSGRARGEWIDECSDRARRLQKKRGLPGDWLSSLMERCARLKAADR